MEHNVSIEDLRSVVAFGDLPDAHLQWILDHSVYLEFEDGATIMKTGDPAENMWFLLEGRVDFYMDVMGKLVFYYSFENTEETGGVGGLLPYSRMKTSPGMAYAVGKVRGMHLNKMHFPELEQLSPDLIQRLIGYMTERARRFATTKLQHEKVNALGNLAAGIAHELNNPAAAITRISCELNTRLKQNYELTEKLLKQGLSSEHIEQVRTLISEKNAATTNKLSAMQRLEMEDEISDWLKVHGLADSSRTAETFADAGFLIADLENICGTADEKQFVQLLHWLENLLGSERLLKDLDLASGRISKLVTAIKSHVHMDRGNDAECCTDIQNDIENTLTLLGYKLREKNIKVVREFREDLPQVEAYIGELNQVWTNIIDNAIFALDMEGEIRVATSTDKKNVTVKIIDNGAGIPSEIQSRVFDPFFTTKKVGQGTGIGLDLVKRIVNRHHGEIKLRSVPGKTEFTVCIPVSQKLASNT